MFAHMEAALAQHHREVAAVIVEPLVQCAGGMRMYDPVYLKLLRQACDRYGVHLIADEIAVGFGRTGTMFACEQAGIRPDYLCLSKGLTGGYLPLSVVLTTDAIYDAFYDEYIKLNAFLHSHSYTGNPLACAAANATLAIFREQPVLERNRATAREDGGQRRAPVRTSARRGDPPARHDPRHRAGAGSRHARRPFPGRSAAACASIGTRSSAACCCGRSAPRCTSCRPTSSNRRRSSCWRAWPPKASSWHAPDAHPRAGAAGRRHETHAARAGRRTSHARAATGSRRAARSCSMDAAANMRRGWAHRNGKQVSRARAARHQAIERESPLDVTLLQGIARGERMDLIVQKATELGVTRIVPFTAERSVVQDRCEAARAQASNTGRRWRCRPASNAVAIACLPSAPPSLAGSGVAGCCRTTRCAACWRPTAGEPLVAVAARASGRAMRAADRSRGRPERRRGTIWRWRRASSAAGSARACCAPRLPASPRWRHCRRSPEISSMRAETRL